MDNGVAVGANTDSFGGLAIGAFYLLGLQFFALYNLSILAKELKGGPNGVHFVEEAPQHVQWFFTRLRQHHRRWGILIFYIDTRVRDQVSPTILEIHFISLHGRIEPCGFPRISETNLEVDSALK